MVALEADENKTGVDIVVPLQRFHSIAGVVEAKADGHRVNAGTVRLTSPNDPSFNRVASVQKDGTFEFDLVPAGTYVARVEDAKDSQGRLIQTDGRMFYTVDTMHEFGPAQEQILLQTTDVTNVVLSVRQ